MLFVADGISQGRQWGTFYGKANGALARHRGLPMRGTRDEAEQDLREYAGRKGLEEMPIGGDDSGEDAG